MKFKHLLGMVAFVFASSAMAGQVNPPRGGAGDGGQEEATAIVGTGGSLRIVDEEEAKRIEQQQQQQEAQARQPAPQQAVPSSYQNPAQGQGTVMAPNGSQPPVEPPAVKPAR